MTRGQIVCIAPEKLCSSVEFNGDMYIEDGYGVDVIEGLKEVKTLDDYKDFVLKFNKEHHKYDDVSRFVYDLAEKDTDEEKKLLGMSEGDYFEDWFSDYLYIKNIRGEAVTITDRDGKEILLDDGGILVLYFGRFDEECVKYSLLAGVTPVVKEKESFESVCKKMGWTVQKSTDGERYDVTTSAPSGHGFYLTVDAKTPITNLIDIADNFDPDTHAVEWYKINCGKNRNLRELICDAEAMKGMLIKLAKELMKRCL